MQQAFNAYVIYVIEAIQASKHVSLDDAKKVCRANIQELESCYLVLMPPTQVVDRLH